MGGGGAANDDPHENGQATVDTQLHGTAITTCKSTQAISSSRGSPQPELNQRPTDVRFNYGTTPYHLSYGKKQRQADLPCELSATRRYIPACRRLCARRIGNLVSLHSSNGRATASHAVGRGIDAPHLQILFVSGCCSLYLSLFHFLFTCFACSFFLDNAADE